MKKLIILSLMLVSGVVFVPSVQAREATVSLSPAQELVMQPGRYRRYRRTRTVITTRVRWVNGARYRETIRTTYFRNGRTRTVIVNRVRLGGRRIYRNY